MAETDFEKPVKDAIVAALAKDSPAPVLAQIICQHLGAASRTAHDPKPAVVAVCRGGVSAVFLAGQDPVAVSISLLEALPNMSLMGRVGPSELMSWAMEGIAEASLLAGPDVRDRIAARIEEKFMGAGQVFESLCHAAKQRSGK